MIATEKIMSSEGFCMKLLGQMVGNMYSNIYIDGNHTLDCCTFDASGESRTKGIQKTSIL